jgi:hypothetical protein
VRVPKGRDPADIADSATSGVKVAKAGAEEGDGPTKLLWMKVGPVTARHVMYHTEKHLQVAIIFLHSHRVIHHV